MAEMLSLPVLIFVLPKKNWSHPLTRCSWASPCCHTKSKTTSPTCLCTWRSTYKNGIQAYQPCLGQLWSSCRNGLDDEENIKGVHYTLLYSKHMNKKIYFAGSIRGGRDYADLYQRMIHHIQKTDKVLTEHIGCKDINLMEIGCFM